MRFLIVAAALTGCSHPAPMSQPPVPPPPSPPPPPAAPAPPSGAPAARTVDVVDRDFGIEAADPYRWMEGTTNAERDAWMLAQGERAANLLAKLPGRERLHARVRELGLGVGAVFNVQLAGGRIFYNELPAGEQLARLAVRDADGKVRVLVDPAARSAQGSHVSLEAYAPSHDGKLVSYVTASGGSEVGTLHLMDVASGKDLPDAIERVWGEGAASWLPDGKHFFYNQLPADGDDPLGMQITRVHEIGTPVANDAAILPRAPGVTLALAPGEWPGAGITPGTDWVLGYASGARSEQRVSFAKLSELDRSGQGKTAWRSVAAYSDGAEVTFVHGDRIYVMTYSGAPNRRLVSVPLAHPELAKARVEIPEDPESTLVGAYIARDALYMLRRVNGRGQMLRWPWTGKAEAIALPFEGWIPDIATDPLHDGVVFQIETWLAPGRYFRYDVGKRALVPLDLASSTTADFSHMVAEEVEAPSFDGTGVPLTILHAKDIKLDGSHPTVVYAYGAYGASQSPGFNASRLAWLERGGVYAIAHVRGGGERGRRWQDDGSRDKKMNGVRDVIACGEYLVAHGFTSRDKLAVQGASMGGLLMGRVITERPDLFAAANVGVGFVNPLRLMHAENGPNQKPEVGDPATEAGYRSVYEMDPYLHVRHTTYPATIFTVGLHDHRVAPWMTTKMAARMLALATGSRPIIVRIDPDAGHGHGSTRDQAFAERADVWSFFLASFGDPDFVAR